LPERQYSNALFICFHGAQSQTLSVFHKIWDNNQKNSYVAIILTFLGGGLQFSAGRSGVTRFMRLPALGAPCFQEEWKDEIRNRKTGDDLSGRNPGQCSRFHSGENGRRQSAFRLVLREKYGISRDATE